MTFGQVQGDLTAGIWRQIFRDLQQIDWLGQEERPADMETPRKTGNTSQGQVSLVKLFSCQVHQDCSQEVKEQEKEPNRREVHLEVRQPASFDSKERRVD